MRCGAVRCETERRRERRGRGKEGESLGTVVAVNLPVVEVGAPDLLPAFSIFP